MAAHAGMEAQLKDGKRIQGVLLKEGDSTIIQSTGGLLQLIPQERIAEIKDIVLDEELGLTCKQFSNARGA